MRESRVCPQYVCTHGTRTCPVASFTMPLHAMSEGRGCCPKCRFAHSLRIYSASCFWRALARCGCNHMMPTLGASAFCMASFSLGVTPDDFRSRLCTQFHFKNDTSCLGVPWRAVSDTRDCRIEVRSEI